ncbi:16148_t:CDS:2 [Dentiscutata erythropus]|uniref:16148_t:CDS:1 n=1 Tax=Dentiscutata erythropus TaxID=1348616 RepID=A0A9N9DWF2_9GLOM|nr:16148_t:CDS:2 [Dentiscutata erythropus]
MYYMDNRISYCSNNNIDFALPFNECFDKSFDEIINRLTTLFKLRNIDNSNFVFVIGNVEDSIFKNSDLKYQFNLVSVIGNVKNDEYQSNFISVFKIIEDNICEINLR